MNKDTIPQLVPTDELPAYFRSRGISYQACAPVRLGFGEGNPQYRLYDYPGPADNETMGLFCEWHTEDFFDVDTGPHVAIGLRGPTAQDPHRGRGLAIGILASHTYHPEDPDTPVPLFKGCPDWPGGPSLFVEDFSLNDGVNPIATWQLSPGRHLPELLGRGVFRIDIHVSRNNVWAGVWKVTEGENALPVYRFLDQVTCLDKEFDFAGLGCRELDADHGCGNAFIGAGFADPENSSRVERVFLAHWNNQA